MTITQDPPSSSDVPGRPARASGRWCPTEEEIFALALPALAALKAEEAEQVAPTDPPEVPQEVPEALRRPKKLRVMLGCVVIIAIAAGAFFAVSARPWQRAQPAHLAVAIRPSVSQPLDPTSAYLAAVKAGASGAVLKAAPVSALVGVGLGACVRLDRMSPARAEADMLAVRTGSDLPSRDVILLIRASAAHLCPSHDAAVRDWSAHGSAIDPSPFP